MATARDRQRKLMTEAGVKPKVQKVKEVDKRNAYIRKQIIEAFSTDAGIVALAYIGQTLCGWRQNDAVAKNSFGGIDMESTMYNSARRAVYTELSALLPRDVLKQAEFYQLKKEDLDNE